MESRRRRLRRPLLSDDGLGPLAIRVGHRRSQTRYHELQVYGARDAFRFGRLVQDQVSAHPKDPLVISVNGYQPWLGEVLQSCIQGYWSEVADLDRAVQFASTMQFPERASKRGLWLPWTFIIDHMNVPQVYYWSVGMEPPREEDRGLATMESFRFRTGVWFCGRGACRFDRNVSVTIIFTKPTPVSEHIVTQLMFDFLWRDSDFDQPREDEEGICWTFSRLYYLLTDWQNIIGEVLARLDEAESNSHGRHLPVKTRTRRMHKDVDRIFEMKEYLHFHTRTYRKLQRLKGAVPEPEQQDPLWNDIDDALEDLEQFDSTLDGLKERFNNLIELEFNITNATQSEDSAFLSAVATLFLPVSFLASLFGMTTISWPAIWFVYMAVPAFILSIIFTAAYPWARRRIQKTAVTIEERRLRLKPDQFTMLGDDYPDNVNIHDGDPAGRPSRARNQAGGAKPLRSQSRKRSQSHPRARSMDGMEKGI